MSDVVQLSQPVKTDEYNGGCPVCGESDKLLNVGRNHWGVCHEHQMAWFIGANLFSGWREQAEADWAANSDKLASYRVVEPVFPQMSLCPRCNAQTMHLKSGIETQAHHPLCRTPGTDEPSRLSDDTVRDVIRYLKSNGYSVRPVVEPGDEIPF